ERLFGGRRHHGEPGMLPPGQMQAAREDDAEPDRAQHRDEAQPYLFPRMQERFDARGWFGSAAHGSYAAGEEGSRRREEARRRFPEGTLFATRKALGPHAHVAHVDSESRISGFRGAPFK